MLLAITGFVMIGLLMYFLLKGKAIPVTLFVVLPIVGALINGFGITEITDFIKTGVSTTWSMAALFVFVITYFGIMSDVGMFDKLVKKLIKVANGRVLAILLVVVAVSILGHLDGNSPTTYLIVIPALHHGPRHRLHLSGHGRIRHGAEGSDEDQLHPPLDHWPADDSLRLPDWKHRCINAPSKRIGCLQLWGSRCFRGRHFLFPKSCAIFLMRKSNLSRRRSC